MTVRGVGFVGMRSERLDETVALFRDIISAPITRQNERLVGFQFEDGTILELCGPANEFHALSHQSGDEGDVAGEPVELGDNDRAFCRAGHSKRGCELWASIQSIGALAALYVDELSQQGDAFWRRERTPVPTFSGEMADLRRFQRPALHTRLRSPGVRSRNAKSDRHRGGKPCQRPCALQCPVMAPNGPVDRAR